MDSVFSRYEVFIFKNLIRKSLLKGITQTCLKTLFENDIQGDGIGHLEKYSA